MINDDVVFEIELINQIEINVGYILMPIQRNREQHGDGDDKGIRAEISRAVEAISTLRNKRDLIEGFVDSLTTDGNMDQEWQTFIAARREAELEAIIKVEHLRPDETRAYIEASVRDGVIQSTGTAIEGLAACVSLRRRWRSRQEEKASVRRSPRSPGIWARTLSAASLVNSHSEKDGAIHRPPPSGSD